MARIRIRVNPSRKPSRTRTIKPKQRVPISNILRKKVRTIERKGKTRKRTKSLLS